MTVSDYIRAYTRQFGLPRRPCGHAIDFLFITDGENKDCEECEKEKGVKINGNSNIFSKDWK